MSADVKKPPVAPKPNFILMQKSVPPPIAPKPDIILSNKSFSSKKNKPAIAPKPKLPPDSHVLEVGTATRKTDSRVLEKKHKALLETSLRKNCRNEAVKSCSEALSEQHEQICMCSKECHHKAKQNDSDHKLQLITDQVDRLEELVNDESNAQIKTEYDEKPAQSQIRLKATVLEEKVNISAHTFATPVLRHSKDKSYDEDNERDLSCCMSSVEKNDLSRLSKLALESSDLQDDYMYTSESISHAIPPSESWLSSLECGDTSCTLKQGCLEHKPTYASSDPPSFPDEGDNVIQNSLELHSVKIHPVPKPRKPRVSALVRQDCFEAPADETEDSSLCNSSSYCIPDTSQNQPTKEQIIEECVSYAEQHTEEESQNKCESEKGQVVTEDLSRECTSTEGDSASMTPLGTKLDTDTVKDALIDIKLESSGAEQRNSEDSTLLVSEELERNSFIRCSSLSMSLPKQLKLSCTQHLSASGGLVSSEVKNYTEQTHSTPEASPRIAPKKPQRHSLPAAGILKKAASEDFIEKKTYISHLAHLHQFKESCVSFSETTECPAEKLKWKLAHPILPYSGSTELLKSSSAYSVEHSNSLTKPRAKSMSAADAERIEKPNKEYQKKNAFKKLFSTKLTFCIMKSDFQRLLSKGSPSSDRTSVGLHAAERNDVRNRNSVPCTGNRKLNSTKAYSADSCNKGIRNKTEHDMNRKVISLDEQYKSGGNLPKCSACLSAECTHGYENVHHYEEIPEYMNLPFAVNASRCSTPHECLTWQTPSSAEDSDTSLYEVQDPYERAHSSLGTALQNTHIRISQELRSCMTGLEDIHTDEEEVINSSDEEDDTLSSSESSRGDLDQQEDQQIDGRGRKAKVYHIAQEIMNSEKVFVDVLKLLHIDFRDIVAHNSRQQGKPVIEEKFLSQILYYLPQLYELNRDILRELEERIPHWKEHQRLADIFVKKGPYLKMYSTYIKEFAKNITLLDEQCKKNPGFAAVVREFEMSPRCANLALKHYLLKPVQRIPQYRLLLTDYLKNLKEDSADYKDTQSALAIVIEVANHANDIMKQGDNFQKLMQIQYSLNGNHEIVQPGRIFLKEGTLMKLSRKVMQPRMFFLFSDALLYTTPVQSGSMYKLNNMLSLAGMKVSKPSQEAYQNELNIESVERSFILSASSATERDEWLEAISKAIEEYAKKKTTFSASRSLEEVEPEKEEADYPLGSKAPIWIPDTRATMCMICTCEFTLTWRRHHCRTCGRIICQACSSNRYRLEYLKNQLARVCDHCFKALQTREHLTTPKASLQGSHRSPTSALSTVLHSIPSGRKLKKIPAALKEVSASTEDSSMSGYLHRSKGIKKPWKHLWFVIKNKVLYTYAASEDVAALESQPLLGFTLHEVKDEGSEPTMMFQLLHKNTLYYIFKADDHHTAQRWIEAFREATVL